MRHTIRFQPSAPPPWPHQQAGAVRLRRYGLVACVGVVLAVGGFGGMSLNRNPTASRYAVTPASLELAEDSGGTASDGSAIEKPLARLTPAAAAQIRPVPDQGAEITPPEDPFLPSHAEPKAAVAASGPSVAGPEAGVPSAGGGVKSAVAAGAPAAAPSQPAPQPAQQSAPKEDELSVTGIVQGDTPVAVVKYEGQSFFLKIGEQVADTWRLVEIKERSVLFQLGTRRVEIPIQGGSSK